MGVLAPQAAEAKKTQASTVQAALLCRASWDDESILLHLVQETLATCGCHTPEMWGRGNTFFFILFTFNLLQAALLWRGGTVLDRADLALFYRPHQCTRSCIRTNRRHADPRSPGSPFSSAWSSNHSDFFLSPIRSSTQGILLVCVN